ISGDPYQSPSLAALYDPVANTWSTTGPVTTARYDFTATVLKDGRVLVAGGDVEDTSTLPPSGPIFLASAELYDPSTKTWTATADLPSARAGQAGVLRPDGRVLLAGGDAGHQAVADAAIYDPATNTWSSSTPQFNIGDDPTAAALSNGKVIITGGPY